jgi:hypothetical protein
MIPSVHFHCFQMKTWYNSTRSYKNSYIFQDRMKEEDMMDTTDILAHLSGLNSYSYKYKCTIESWI